MAQEANAIDGEQRGCVRRSGCIFMDSIESWDSS
jgi:hypothetical protein